MTALAEDRNTLRKEGIRLRVPVEADAVIYIGAMVCLNEDGFAVPAADTAGLRFIGVASEHADATDLDNGEATVLIWIDGEFLFEFSGDLTQADVGYTAFVVFDSTVGRKWTPVNDIACGVITQIDAADVATDQVWVQIRPAAGLDYLLFNLRNFWAVRACSDEFAEIGMEAAGVTSSGTLAEDNDLSNTFVSAASAAATTGLTSGWIVASFDYIRRAHNPAVVAIIRTAADITDQRIWVGLFSATPAAADEPAISLIGFRYSTAAPDVNWAACTATAAGIEATDSGVVVAAATEYNLKFIVDDLGVSFFINGAYVGRHLDATALDYVPAAATELGAAALLTTLADAVHTWSFCIFLCTQGGVL